MVERLLASLGQIHLGGRSPADFLIILVDNDPDGRTRSIYEKASAAVPIRVLFVEEPRRGRPFARNRAVAEAMARKIDFVAFIDDDDLPAPDWLHHLLEIQIKTQADIVYGIGKAVVNLDWPDWLRNSVFFKTSPAEGLTKYSTPRGVSTFNVLIGRSVFERLHNDGFVFLPEFERLEDTDFFIRAASKHFKFARSEDSVIHKNYESHRLSATGLLREALLNGIYAMRLLKKHGSPVQVRHRKKKALKKITLAFLKFPICIFSATSLMNNLFILTREMGMLYICHEKFPQKVTKERQPSR
jgi:glycosyltransferase involved in cell wall biosynthesis